MSTRLPQPKKNNALRAYGYSLSLPAKQREAALDKAIRGYMKKRRVDKRQATLSTYRRVVLLRTLNKHRPSLYQKLNTDASYLQKKYDKFT